MHAKRTVFLGTLSVLVSVAAVVAGGALTGCSGKDGEPGAAGEAGPQGNIGPIGPIGPPGPASDGGVVSEAGTAGCLAPCHGFGNVVDQWRYSLHYIMSATSPDEPLWTTAGSPCGNCHAIDGLERRLAKDVAVADGGTATNPDKGHLNYTTSTGSAAEAQYTGTGRAAVVHCSTCHAFTTTNDPHTTGGYVPGSAPLRVPAGPTDFSLLEKTVVGGATPAGQEAGNYKSGNTCIFCHKSRKDVTFYITASNSMSSRTWGPHNGPQADIYTGKGGYEFAGKLYGKAVHTTMANGCPTCHMPPVVTNKNTPDHSMRPQVSFCKTCHTAHTGSTFDVGEGRTFVKGWLFKMEKALSDLNLITRSTSAPYAPLTVGELADGAFELDAVRPNSGAAGAHQVLDADTAGAVYNYLLIARGKDLGVHNPPYTKQLLWDSYDKITGGKGTADLGARPKG